MIEYTKINSQTWDLWADNGCEWSVPISHDEYEAVSEGNFGVYLTPCITVPHEWFGDLKNKRLLGLAKRRRSANACVFKAWCNLHCF